MNYVLFVIWSVWVLLSGLAAMNVWFVEWRRRRQDARYFHSDPANRPRVAIITCIKGFHADHTPNFLRSLCCQHYGNYRLILAFEDEKESAIKWVKQNLSSGEHSPLSIDVVIAGHTQTQGQKVHNQIAAFDRLDDEDEIIAFADADIHCDRDWLDELTAPIRYDIYELASGNRFPLPMDGRVSTLTASTMLMGVCTIASFDLWDIGWGGSMAISRTAFENIQVPTLLKGCLNDDVQISIAARRSGFPVGRRVSLFVASPISYSWKELVEFGTRQYYHIRKYSWTTYALATYATGIYTLGFLTAVIAAFNGSSWAWWVLGITVFFDQIRAVGRSYLVSQCVPDKDRRFRIRSALMEHCLTPLWMIMHFGIVIGAALRRSITWGGITYKVTNRNQTQILNDPRQQILDECTDAQASR